MGLRSVWPFLIATAGLISSCGTDSAIANSTGTVRPSVDLPSGSGPLFDESLTADEFEAALEKLGYCVDDVIADDGIYTDIGGDVPFAQPDEVSNLARVELAAAAVLRDDLVVAYYIAGNSQCSAPIGGSVELVDGSVDVALYHGNLRDPDTGGEGCLDVPGDWRATFVVKGARTGMSVGRDGTQEGRTTLAPPLIENLRAALIYPDELPPVDPSLVAPAAGEWFPQQALQLAQLANPPLIG